MAIWACQAGKDVYVEKPVSHNVWEGRKLVEAAAKYGRIVEAGTQSRSDEALLELAADVRAGKLGKLLRARGFCYKRRESIGKVDGPQPIPASVHYDLFCGPAPLEPLRRQQLHYDWHWFWATGNGDIGNQGVHEMDVCRWMLGEEKLPPRVFSIGGRFGYVDDGETPNTQIAVLDYPTAPDPLRGARAAAEDRRRLRGPLPRRAHRLRHRGRGRLLRRRPRRRLDPRPRRQEGEAVLRAAAASKHMENFIQARAQPQAAGPGGPGRRGAHLLGAVPPREHLVPPGDGPDADGGEGGGGLARRRGGDPGSLRDPPRRQRGRLRARRSPVLGPVLDVLPDEERFASRSEYDLGAFANRVARGTYRPPYVVPEVV